jgi:YfiH family protein
MMSVIELMKAPGWERLPWLRHGFSTRQGGRSTVYGGHSLNLGWTKEDEPQHVQANRRTFAAAVAGAGTEMPLVTIRQVHSAIVKAVGSEALNGNLATPEGKAVLEGDGLVTNVPGVLISAGTADCVPVLVVDPVRRAVGAFHAGWRGTVAGIVGEGISLMRSQYGSQSEDLLAAIGPSIGGCCYAVGEEVREQFVEAFSYGDELFRHETGQLYVDLWQANRRQLQDAGIGEDKIAAIGECTACSRTSDGERKYFSHRAEQGKAGRMLNAIGIVP